MCIVNVVKCNCCNCSRHFLLQNKKNFKNFIGMNDIAEKQVISVAITYMNFCKYCQTWH